MFRYYSSGGYRGSSGGYGGSSGGYRGSSGGYQGSSGGYGGGYNRPSQNDFSLGKLVGGGIKVSSTY